MIRALALLLAALPLAATAQTAPPARPASLPEAPAPQTEAARPPERPARPAVSEEATDSEEPSAEGAITVEPPASRDGTDDAAQPETQSAPEPAKGALIPPAAVAAPPAESDFDHSACLLALSILGAGYETVEPVAEAGNSGCGIARPVRIIEALPGIAVEGGAVMRCATARALALWLRDEVLPAAAALPGAPRLSGLVPGSTYQCRGRVGDGTGPAKLSEHALGNAIDIAAFRFADAPELKVQPLKEGGDAGLAFMKAVQAGACLRFTTVLGPGSNAAHDDHLHLDLARRRGGWRLCQ